MQIIHFHSIQSQVIIKHFLTRNKNDQFISGMYSSSFHLCTTKNCLFLRMNKSMTLLLAVGILYSLLVFMPESTEAGCGCNQWCWDHGWTWGICGDGDTCICYNRRGFAKRDVDNDTLDYHPRNIQDNVDHQTFIVDEAV